MEYETAWRLAITLTLVGVLLDAVQQLVTFGALYSDVGSLPASVLGLRSVRGRKWRFTRLFSPAITAAVLVVRISAAATAISAEICVESNHSLSTYAAAVVTISMAWLHFRNARFGIEGSDQMRMLVLISYVVYGTADSKSLAYYASGVFVVFQLILAYLFAGTGKLASKVWRNGDAIRQITRMTEYQSTLVGRSKTASVVLSWFTITFQVSSPLALASPTLCTVFIIGGIVFHLMVATRMGLNLFLPSFTAPYPLLFWLTHTIHT